MGEIADEIEFRYTKLIGRDGMGVLMHVVSEEGQSPSSLVLQLPTDTILMVGPQPGRMLAVHLQH